MNRRLLSAILVGTALFSGCAGAARTVLTLEGHSSAPALYTSENSARKGIVRGSDNPAFFMLPPEARLSLSAGTALELFVSVADGRSVDIALAALTAADFSSPWQLFPELTKRPFSTVTGCTGELRIRMTVSDIADTALAITTTDASGSAPAAFSGFALRVTPSASDTAPALESGPPPAVTVRSATLTAEARGWQISPRRWFGFGPDGGFQRFDNPEALVSVVSGHSLEVGLPAVGAESTPEKQQTLTVRGGGQYFSFRLGPRSAVSIVPPFLLDRAANSSPLFSADGPVLPESMISRPVNYTGAGSLPIPISADPHLVVQWPQDAWRDSRYEIFAWDRFPSILIFDTADYAVQDLFFKRLAFFVEKQGYRGQLHSDAALAGLHAFNAHDYRASSLAEFFELARLQSFSLNREEQLLRDLLLAEGIIREDAGAYREGRGAVLSISRASLPYLRYLFIAHEGLHGLYFTDAEFRAKVHEVYSAQDSRARSFLESYFTVIDALGYDTADTYLMENEFMAYLLQQPLDRVVPYFVESLVPRYLRFKGDPSLADWVTGSGAAAFVASASRLNDYIFERWGISAGRVGMFSFRD